MASRIKVLYIAGWGRSGSTLLGNIIGNVEGFAHLGEMYYIFDRAIAQNWRCGCGKLFSDCDKWRKVMECTLTEQRVSIEEMLTIRSRLHSRYLLFPRPLLQWYIARTTAKLRSVVERLYLCASTVFRADVLVDSSKHPIYAYFLDTLPGVELYIVHLVRNPIETGYSWWKRQKAIDPIDQSAVMPAIHPIKQAVKWLELNYLIEKTWAKNHNRYLLVRYEDFISSPREIVQRVVALLGQGATDLPFRSERVARLREQHTVSGNPIRFQTGDVMIRSGDDTGRRGLPLPYRKAISMICFPYMKKMGYL